MSWDFFMLNLLFLYLEMNYKQQKIVICIGVFLEFFMLNLFLNTEMNYEQQQNSDLYKFD